MELIIGDTILICFENGDIERFHKRCKKWTVVKKTLNANGYLTIQIENKLYLSHRIIYKAFHPEFDLYSPLHIDHINRDKTDNRIENLRLVSNQQNQFNTNAKGYTKRKFGFEAQIVLNGKRYSKRFKIEEDARNWYLEQKAILHIID